MKKSAVVLMLLFVGAVHAVNIQFGPNGCTLKDAIRSANADAPRGNCSAGSGTDVLIAPDGWFIVLDAPLPTITSDLTIRSTSNADVVTISGDDTERILEVTGNNTEATLERVHLVSAFSNFFNGAGAALRVHDATVNLIDSRVSGGYVVDANGSAIAVFDGVLNLDNTLITNNETYSATFGLPTNPSVIYAVDSLVNVVDSTFTFNDTASVLMNGGELVMTGSLVNEQINGVAGKGAQVNISNSTFQKRPSAYDELLLFFEENSSVSLNHITSTSEMIVRDSILSVSNSILTTCYLTDTSVILNTHNRFIVDNCLGFANNPNALPLADNGGPTLTKALSFNSTAINNGDPVYCQAIDQRGEARIGPCDIGAFEATGFADVETLLTLSAAAPYVGNQVLTANVIVRNNGPGLATAVNVEFSSSQAFVQNINSALCSAFPCVINSIGAGQSIIIPVEMVLGNPFNSPFSINAEASSTINSTHDDPDEGDVDENNFAELTEVINTGADLAVEMHLISAPPFFIGQSISYEATISNAGAATANNIELELLPFGLTVTSFAGCSSSSGSLCFLSGLLNGGQQTITINTEITQAQFNAVALVEADQVDINQANNIDDQNNNGGISNADISVAMNLLQSGPYYSDQYIEFEITVKSGNQAASNIQLWSEFPGASYIGIGFCQSIPCVIDQLPANTEVSTVFQFFAPVAYPGVIDSMSHRVYATPGQYDPNLSDNEVIITQPLVPAANVAVSLNLVTPPPYYIGQEVQYDLTVFNGGVNDANFVNINHIPSNLNLLWVAGEFCDTLSCIIPRIDFFNNQNMTLMYQINATGPFNLTVSAFANEIDELPNDNTDNSNNGGVAELLPDDLIFADDFD